MRTPDSETSACRVCSPVRNTTSAEPRRFAGIFSTACVPHRETSCRHDVHTATCLQFSLASFDCLVLLALRRIPLPRLDIVEHRLLIVLHRHHIVHLAVFGQQLRSLRLGVQCIQSDAAPRPTNSNCNAVPANSRDLASSRTALTLPNNQQPQISS